MIMMTMIVVVMVMTIMVMMMMMISRGASNPSIVSTSEEMVTLY